jgi:hypothetical protein
MRLKTLNAKTIVPFVTAREIPVHSCNCTNALT